MQQIPEYPALNMAEKHVKTLLMNLFQKNQKGFWTLFQKKRRWKQIPTNPLDIQHFIASKYIDYTRLRIYKIRKLLSLVSFYNKHIGTINIGKQTNMK